MKKAPNYVAACLFCALGLAVYFLIPIRGSSFLLGLILQLLCAAALFILSVPSESSLGKFLKLARANAKEHRVQLIVSTIIALICGSVLLIGIKWGFVRFILFALMWIGLIGAAETVALFLFCRFNRAFVDAEIEKTAQAERDKKERETQEAEREKQRREREAQEAEQKALKEAQRKTMERNALKAAKEKDEKDVLTGASSYPVRLPIHASPDAEVLLALMNESALGLQAALSRRTPEALAAVEGIIMYFSHNKTPKFYRLGGMRFYTEQFIQAAKTRLLALADEEKLLQDPGYSQSLIAGLGATSDVSNQIMQTLAVRNDHTLFHYQLLGVQMQLAKLLEQGVQEQRTDRYAEKSVEQEKPQVQVNRAEEEARYNEKQATALEGWLSSATKDERGMRTRTRIRIVPDGGLLHKLKSGDETALQAALARRTPEALAAIEETVALYSGNPDPLFHCGDRSFGLSEKELEAILEQIAALAMEGKLLNNPKHSQSLIAEIAVSQDIHDMILRRIAPAGHQSVYDYKLLHTHMLLAQTLEYDL